MKPDRGVNQWLLLGVLLLAFGLRTIALQTRSLWYDEIHALLLAEKGWPAMLAGTLGASGNVAAEEHPLLYHVFLWGWIGVLGSSPFALRLLSVFVGLLTVVVAFGLARALLGPRPALVCALFVALAPFPIHYAQETRMYGLLALWLTGATWVYLRAIRAGRDIPSAGSGQALARHGAWPFGTSLRQAQGRLFGRGGSFGFAQDRYGGRRRAGHVRDWIAFGLLAALAQYTHTLAALYLVPLALTPVWLRRWRAVGYTALAGLTALALYLPWLLNVPRQFAKLQQGFWIARPGLAELVRSLIVFTVNLPLPEGWLWLSAGLFVTLLGATLAAWQIVRAVRAGQPGARGAAWLLYLGGFPLLLMFLISQFRPIYIERALLAAAVVYLLALGWGLTQAGMPRPIAAFSLAGLLVVGAAGLFTHYTYTGFPYAPYAQLAQHLASERAPSDVIVHSNKLTHFPTHYYDRTLPQAFVADPSGSGADTLSFATQEVLGLYAQPGIESAVGGSPRVWFVIFDRAIEEYQALGEATHPHLAWLEAHYTLDSVRHFDDLSLYEFVLP